VKIIGSILLLLLGIAAGLLLAALIRTLCSPRKVSAYVPDPDPERALQYAQKLSEMVKFETVSRRGVERPERFREFHKVLARLFPTVWEKLEITELDGNLLIRWEGKHSERPLVLMGHQDVVPAEGEWLHGAFSGDIADGKVWGRGANDTKCSVLCILQTLEELLQSGYIPEQDVYFSSSCTEEIGGDGAPKIVAELKRRGVRPYMICDEGGGIVSNPVGGVEGNFAMLGVLEKGIGVVCFSARSNGGHASAPRKNMPLARLAAFQMEIEHHNPLKKQFCPELEEMFAKLSSYADFPMRFLLGNLWLFKPLLTKIMPAISPEAAAMLGTTIAFTMQGGSEAPNAIPQEAWVKADMRFIPHQDRDESVAVMAEVAGKYDLETTLVEGSKACTPVDIHGRPFVMATRAIEENFPGLAWSPYVMTGGTDARFFNDICDNCLRFSPLIYGPEQMKGMHGLNENIEYNCLPGAVDFYKTLIRLNDEE